MNGSLSNALIGWMLVATTALVVLSVWTGVAGFDRAAEVVIVPLTALLTIAVGWGRRIFVAVAAVLVVMAVVTRPDWHAIVNDALARTAFIVAFFTALASLRNASASSAAIETCGRFLAGQPPGRRYAALTVGGQLFALLLNYGSLILLGSMAEANARTEPDPERRRHRIRRMLLAIQRGFLSTLPWSPMAFAVAVTLSIVPGAKWAESVGYCIVSGAILAGVGWGLDTIFKPRIAGPPTNWKGVDNSWFTLWPLVLLLAVLGVIVLGLHLATGISIPGIVMLVVPMIGLVWIALQNRASRPLATALARANGFTTLDLPGYRSEIVLLMMAGFIGTLGSSLLGPYVAASGVDFAALPGWAILVIIVWFIPLCGQIGMNPIMTVALFAPLLPDAAAMGLETVDVVTAITTGWALSGASSPFTATTVLVGSIGHVSASHVGVRWNGAYSLVCGIALSVWVAVLAVI
ncbi:MAG: hypothetical protein RIC16_07555 [Rhodospirillales bacterium]